MHYPFFPDSRENDWYIFIGCDQPKKARAETLLQQPVNNIVKSSIMNKQSHKETWHYTLTYEFSFQLYGIQLFHFYSMWNFTSYLYSNNLVCHMIWWRILISITSFWSQPASTLLTASLPRNSKTMKLEKSFVIVF